MNNKVIILGCGSSSGVPLAGYPAGPFWGNCDPNNPKNNRSRASIYVEYQGVRLLIDTTPDLRQQLLRHNLCDFDAIMITHFHADHCHGIDELRPLYYNRQHKPFNLYTDPLTFAGLQNSFKYLFQDENPNFVINLLPSETTTSQIPKDDVRVNFQYMTQQHGQGTSLGFRFGNMAYSTDFNHLDDHVINQLQGLDLWIVDCLSHSIKATHNHLALTRHWIDRVKPKRAILTHMGYELDYDTLVRTLPTDIQPAYDGMVLEF